MRPARWFVPVALLSASCVPLNVQQQAGFTRAEVRPTAVHGKVGDIVRFDVLPPVSRGTEWDLDVYNRVRFAGDERGTHRLWVAEHDPIHLEAVVAPWDPTTRTERDEAHGWLWFALHETGETEPIGKSLPIAREPCTDLAPVAYTSVFSPNPLADGQPRIRYARTEHRHTVTFKTNNDFGTPTLPTVRPALVETGGRKILYAEVLSNFGSARNENVGYETTLTYPLTIDGPVDVVIVEWVGHGAYFGRFEVYRSTAPG